MELCKRCSGTGHNGNCEDCGGSGFASAEDALLPPHALPVTVITDEVTVWKKPPPRMQRAPQLKLNPLALASDQQVFGLKAEQLQFPSDRTGFGQIAIRNQIRQLTHKYIEYGLVKIQWESPLNCILTLADGHSFRKTFEKPPKQQGSSPANDTRRAPVTQRPKARPMTVPHPSQKTSVTKQVVVRARPGKRMVRVIRDGEQIGVVKNPQSLKTKHSGARKAGKASTTKTSSSGPDTPNAIELAFATAKGDPLDGSRQWSGFRDASDGRYGSHPAFDVSDDTIAE